MNPEDRRSEPRSMAVRQITFECFQHGAKVSQGIANTINLSEHGALVEMPCNIALDASLILSINAPFYTIIVQGDVVHSRQISAHAYHVGVKLTNVIEGNWEKLISTVRAHLENEEHER